MTTSFLKWKTAWRMQPDPKEWSFLMEDGPLSRGVGGGGGERRIKSKAREAHAAEAASARPSSFLIFVSRASLRFQARPAVLCIQTYSPRLASLQIIMFQLLEPFDTKSN